MTYKLENKKLKKEYNKINNLSKLSIASIGAFTIAGSIATSAAINNPIFGKICLTGLSLVMISGYVCDLTYKIKELKKIKRKLQELTNKEIDNIMSQSTDINKEVEKLLIKEL